MRCGIDISDGLVQDLAHLREASAVGAELRLDQVPVDHDLVATYPDQAIDGGDGRRGLRTTAHRPARHEIDQALSASPRR
jgi:thiamine monophosphate kinase